ncbi:AbrB/MazE/SpoVT family DNA-binding domain-containing protein [Chelativorans sp. SCAU2101]|jgi:Regulators of stationary/sporulation gene expression|uniref:AbrB/MazE/SpoVT family DNA-binding domain-containing protein n=1 Tax=Chelativorans petroleitrophicus TaxID=2975484 RepID=A0A9X3AZT1_9HYPH|nr:AbrB/MazE/SpoVT family DNA-binding domain-containing protein [Chelativorans petroleitrophicus]MCT8990229.1 AbrB/MazE/SpoVT family DNA-binding domain-containing protein [Chelativorans petroleitrophicus]
MTTLTVTAKGQVTLKKELLQHLGVKPGQKIEVESLPGGQLAIRAARRKGSWKDVYGILAGKTDKVATIEEMNEAIEKGWAGLLNEDHR